MGKERTVEIIQEEQLTKIKQSIIKVIKYILQPYKAKEWIKEILDEDRPIHYQNILTTVNSMGYKHIVKKNDN